MTPNGRRTEGDLGCPVAVVAARVEAEQVAQVLAAHPQDSRSAPDEWLHSHSDGQRAGHPVDGPADEERVDPITTARDPIAAAWAVRESEWRDAYMAAMDHCREHRHERTAPER